MPAAMTARERLFRVHERIAKACARALRPVESVKLVAVSKTHPAQAVAELAGLGQRVFGESYAQEALPKMEELAKLQLDWHFIGRLQKNKAKYVAGRFGLIHSVDSLDLARMLHKKSVELCLVQPALIQVNLACESRKAGCGLAEAMPLAEGVLELAGLALKGLMLMPPWDENPEANRGFFAGARKLREELSARLGVPLPELSMGMSHDLEQAVEEGATLVRVGTDLFGARET
jgi:hypothetical protein